MLASTTAFSSPFGSQSVFGQTNNANNSMFDPEPFGSTTPSGSQTGGSLFGGTSTGMFGAPQTCGAASSPAFGSSTPSFGATSPSAFGSSSTSYGGSSVFGQSNTQTSPFGSTSQPSQPALGSGLFYSTAPFDASSQPAFGAASSPGFGTLGTPFGSSNTPAFGATGTSGFGARGIPCFGTTITPTFGTTATPAFGHGGGFGVSTSSGFGVTSSAPAFDSTLAFGPQGTPSFNFGSSPSFGQSASPFGNTQFVYSPSPFTAQSSPFSSNAGFGQTGFAGNRGGSRVVAYSRTSEIDNGGLWPVKFESISAMPTYKDKSHEELRWEDYQSGDKGAQATPPTVSNNTGYGQTDFAGLRGRSRYVAYSPTEETNNCCGLPGNLESISAMPIYKDVSHEELKWEDYQSGDKCAGAQATTSTFSRNTGFGEASFARNRQGCRAAACCCATRPVQSLFNTPPPNLFQSTFSFGPTSSSALTQNTAPSPFVSGSVSSTPSLFTSTIGQSNTSQIGNFSNTQPSLSFPPSVSPFTSSFLPTTTPPFNQSNMFNTPSGGFQFSSTQPMMPSNNQAWFSHMACSPFQPSQPSQPTGDGLAFNNFGPSQAAGTSGFTGSTSSVGPNNFSQLSTTQGNVPVQPPVPVTNPFGTLPAMPQMYIGRQAGTTPYVQYGISNLPVTTQGNVSMQLPVTNPFGMLSAMPQIPSVQYGIPNSPVYILSFNLA
ncbi:Nuclear pore complex protein NUP98A [Euphorbia peplus]|nr:Nuclear pore complex protein NUP98A [Euphorbia peplus]